MNGASLARRARAAHVLVVVLALALLAAALACGDGGEVASPVSLAAPDGGDAAAAIGDAATDTGLVRAAYGLDTRPSNATCKAPARPLATSKVAFERVFANVSLSFPMMIAQIPGDNTRWFAAQRDGKIVSFASVLPSDTPALAGDLAVLAGPVYDMDEGGLLGFAFHPKFAQNGRLYVTWTSVEESILGFLTSADGGKTFTSYATVLSFPRGAEHHGGGIAFGKDGFLYASFGDGGPPPHGQLATGFEAKVLRIDVDTPPPPGATYVIPADNPYQAGGGEPATFARGFRNPFRISIDRGTGALWVGDVGRSMWEEIDRAEAGGNYGWPCREGLHLTDPAELNAEECAAFGTFLDPVIDLPRSDARVITGGVVYRGSAMPALRGTYFFGDLGTQLLFSLSFDPTTGAPIRTTLSGTGIPAASWVSFDEDTDGELYAVGFSPVSEIYKMVPQGPAPASTFPDRLSNTGCVDPSDPRKPAPGLLPYDVNAPLWSDGADKERWLALPDGKTIAVKSDGDFDLPVGSVLVKTFSIGGRRIERFTPENTRSKRTGPGAGGRAGATHGAHKRRRRLRAPTTSGPLPKTLAAALMSCDVRAVPVKRADPDVVRP